MHAFNFRTKYNFGTFPNCLWYCPKLTGSSYFVGNLKNEPGLNFRSENYKNNCSKKFSVKTYIYRSWWFVSRFDIVLCPKMRKNGNVADGCHREHLRISLANFSGGNFSHLRVIVPHVSQWLYSIVDVQYCMVGLSPSWSPFFF